MYGNIFVTYVADTRYNKTNPHVLPASTNAPNSWLVTSGSDKKVRPQMCSMKCLLIDFSGAKKIHDTTLEKKIKESLTPVYSLPIKKLLNHSVHVRDLWSLIISIGEFICCMYSLYDMDGIFQKKERGSKWFRRVTKHNTIFQDEVISKCCEILDQLENTKHKGINRETMLVILNELKSMFESYEHR